jgi:hypothetical protein
MPVTFFLDGRLVKSADPSSHIAVSARIPLPASIIVAAVDGTTEGKASPAETPGVEDSAWVERMSRSKPVSTAHPAAHTDAAAVSTTHTTVSVSTAASVSAAASLTG